MKEHPETAILPFRKGPTISNEKLIALHSFGYDIETSWRADRPHPSDAYGHGGKDLSNRHARLRLCQRVRTRQDRLHPHLVDTGGSAEGLNAWQKTGEARYLEAVENQWTFIKAVIINKRPGSEWFWCTNENAHPAPGKPIVEPWKCSYRNGRMVFEIIRRNFHA